MEPITARNHWYIPTSHEKETNEFGSVWIIAAPYSVYVLADRFFRSTIRLNANDAHRAKSRKIVVALGGAVQCTEWNATATPPGDATSSLPLLLRQAEVYNLSSPVIPTISGRRITVGELRWGLALCGVWEGILIQHATHDVGPTMTAPIPALIFHRFYSRPSPPSPHPLPLFHPLTVHTPSRLPTIATSTRNRPCHHGNPIFYTVKPVCLSDRPRLISSFQNRNVMGQWGRECRVIDCSLSDLPTCHSPRGNEWQPLKRYLPTVL